MKNILYTICFLAVIYGCTEASSSKKIEKPKEDSLTYYPPTPQALNQQEFRRYFRVLSDFFEEQLLRRGFNGGILVAKNGNIIYEKYQGFADMRTREPMTDSTSIHIASTSKTFTSIATLQLIQQNKVGLDDSIQRFFPGLPYPGVTVKMLLSHRSGLPNYLYFIDAKNWDNTKKVTNTDVLDFLYTLHPIRSSRPGTHFKYCNTNFVLLAMIIEKVTGISYPDYIRQQFFGPLQMHHSFVFSLKDSLKTTPSFKPNGGVWDDDIYEGTYGDKNIYSTPEDLLKWDQALYTNQLINKALLDSAFTPYSNERKSIHNYGLGFRMLNLPNGKKMIYHFGRWHGFNAAFARLIDEKATIIILGNKFNRNIYNSAHKAYDIFGDYLQNGNKEEDDSDPSEAGSKNGIGGPK